MALIPNVDTDSGSAEDINGSSSTLGSYSPATDRMIAARMKLSSLNGAAATFTVGIVDGNGDFLVKYSMPKGAAADTVAFLPFSPIFVDSAETLSIYILSSNTSDTSVTWAIEWIDAHVVNTAEWLGTTPLVLSSQRVQVDVQAIEGFTAAAMVLGWWLAEGVAPIADSGTTTTLVDAMLTQADDHWNGAMLIFRSGTNEGRTAIVIDFDAATDTLTFAPAVPDAVTTEGYVLIPGLGHADIAAISQDATAAANLKLQYDGTGVSGGTFPARQDQISALSIGAAGLSVNASSVNVTTGNETNSYTDTFSAGVIHIVEDAGGITLYEYEFDLSEFLGTATNFLWTGYIQSKNDTVDVQYYDWVAEGWKTLQTLDGANGTTLIEHDFDVPVAGTGTGANFGSTKLRFSSTSTTAIGTDRVRCIFSQAAAGIKNGSTITLSASQINKNFSGNNWTLVLANQDISGSFFRGAHVTGLSSASTEVTFEDCTFGAGSYPPGHYRRCGIGDADGRFTGASAGDFHFDDCKSAVAGSGTPDFTFSGATNIHNRGWLGGSNYTLDATCMISHEVLEGGGQTFNTGGAAIEVRGTCRSLTVDLNSAAAGLVQFVGTTGPIVITDTGTATGTVNLYGISSSVTDSTAGSATINNLTVNQTNVDAILEDTAVIGAAGAGLTSVALAAAGLDSIPTTEPAGTVATDFREMITQTWRRLFNQSTLTGGVGGQLKTRKDDDVSIASTQAVSNDGTTQTVGKAT